MLGTETNWSSFSAMFCPAESIAAYTRPCVPCASTLVVVKPSTARATPHHSQRSAEVLLPHPIHSNACVMTSMAAIIPQAEADQSSSHLDSGGRGNGRHPAGGQLVLAAVALPSSGERA